MQGDKDLLELGKERALEIISDPETVNMLLAKAKQASPFKNSEPQDVYANRIVGLIKPGEKITIQDIVARVRSQGKSSSDTSVAKITGHAR